MSNALVMFLSKVWSSVQDNSDVISTQSVNDFIHALCITSKAEVTGGTCAGHNGLPAKQQRVWDQ